MPLPPFESSGNLPPGIHAATFAEVAARFGVATARRRVVTSTLQCVYGLAVGTAKLERFIVFGSYVTAKPDPNDVDVILVMRDDFRIEECTGESVRLFDHRDAQATFGASVFWIRPSMLFLETAEEFVNHWQVTRDKSHRGIVEIKHDPQ